MKPTRVAYVAGWGRSGTTLLGQLLGQHSEACDLGEVRNLWRALGEDGWRCSCGEHLRGCQFWTDVIQRASIQTDRDSCAAVIQTQQASLRTRHIPGRLLSVRNPRGLTGYRDALRAIYRASAEAARASVVVDTSKDPASALVLARDREIDLRVVHLVRDPRAVAYSWSRVRPWAGSVADAREMRRQGPVESSAHWLLANLAITSAVRRAVGPGRYLRLRYEDLVDEPHVALTTLTEFLGLDNGDFSVLSGSKRVTVSATHSVAGNPSRFRSGPIEVARDDEWRDKMAPLARLLATSTAAPLMSLMGYPLRDRTVPQEPLRNGGEPTKSGNREQMTRVCYIAGWGRSGTTLLDRILGQLPSFVSVGELRSLWDVPNLSAWPCSCGVAVMHCTFWNAVLGATFRRGAAPAIEDVAALRNRVARTRHILLGSPPRQSAGGAAANYAALLVRLYRAALSQSGSEVVVDSSKHPAEAMLLASMPEIDLTVVHVVRDPRASAFSWTRATAAHPGERGESPPALPRYRPAVSTVLWMTWNTVLRANLRPNLGARYVELRYEDLMRDPAGTLSSVTSAVGGRCDDLPLIDDHTVELAPAHIAVGNPSRFDHGHVSLVADRRWEASMSLPDRLAATIPALPLLRRYGYRPWKPADPQLGPRVAR